jgi:hypothetical protein
VIVFRLTLTVLGALLLVFLIACGAYGLSDVAARHAYDVHASYARVQALKVDGGDGDVRLTAAPAGSAVVVVEHVTEGLTSPHSEAARASGGVLRLSADCSFVFSNSCGASYSIEVPAGVTVDAHAGGGDVDAHGISARSVTLTVPNTTYAVHASSGNGTVSDNTLRIDPTAPRMITASSGNGDVTVKAAGAIGR